MNKICIVKTGSWLASICRLYGDFEDFILRGAGLRREMAEVVSVYRGEALPPPEQFSAVIVTGSAAMVTEREDWSVKTEEWLKEAAGASLPILGICYGHQLLAQAFGGKVGYHPQGYEAGMTEVRLTAEGERDPLLCALPKAFPAYVVHSQTVLAAPAGARVLAKNDFEGHHAVLFGKNVWGVQFHPEFTAEALRMDIESMQGKLLAQGRDYETILSSVGENSYGSVLLKRFVELAGAGAEAKTPSADIR